MSLKDTIKASQKPIPEPFGSLCIGETFTIASIKRVFRKTSRDKDGFNAVDREGRKLGINDGTIVKPTIDAL